MRNRDYHTDADHVEWYREARTDVQRANWGPVERMQGAIQQQANIHLFLVRQHQGAGQPKHWSLVVAPENGGLGNLYQVRGDAVYMCYRHVFNVDIFVSSPYADCYRLGELDAGAESSVARVASQVKPPQAVSQVEVQRNCQDWAVQVIQRLEDRNIVPQGSAAKCASWHDCDNKGARLLG
ncbi:hypothetical protein F5X97DRAFT_315047 [Nemania serpens]|nr:hypothetical protein F5X97DRAFT_315047 [Nemania serpens]